MGDDHQPGREWCFYILLSYANSLTAFAILMGLRGVFQPLYQIGSDAMMADMVLPEKRAPKDIPF